MRTVLERQQAIEVVDNAQEDISAAPTISAVLAGKVIQFPEMMTRRHRFVPIYVSIWLAVLVTLVAAFRS